MGLILKNTRDLISPDKFRMKVLVYAIPGFGKTKFVGGASRPLICAAEYGQGSGLLTIAEMGMSYVEPENMEELDQFTSGILYDTTNKKVDLSAFETLVIDSFSEVTRRFIKAEALTVPRKNNVESAKRKKGIPELDDYGTMGEISRKVLAKFLDNNKNIVVTATVREVGPDEDHPTREHRIGPDLPGQMFLGATAMFDFVLAGVIKPVLRDLAGNIIVDPSKAKPGQFTRSAQRVWLTNPETSGAYLTKCRASLGGNGAVTQPLLANEEVFDLKAGTGTWQALYDKVVKGYKEAYERAKAA